MAWITVEITLKGHYTSDQCVWDYEHIFRTIEKISTELRPWNAILNMQAFHDYTIIHLQLHLTSKCGHGCGNSFKVE